MIRNDLPKAIHNRDLFLSYQPIFDTQTNKLIGTEALIRWNHREKGIIYPHKFIGIAEKTGLIISIGEWVLFNACEQNKKWQDLGYTPLYISINVSMVQLEQPYFYRIVKNVLDKTKLDPKYLQLEITETIFTKNSSLIQENIEEILKMGVKFAIDDFGTGYSSLGQLSEISIGNLKIDRSFINGIEDNPNKRKIIKAVISMARSLNIELTAEGVETEEQLNFLKENRCDMVQGFLLSRPLLPEEIEKILVRFQF